MTCPVWGGELQWLYFFRFLWGNVFWRKKTSFFHHINQEHEIIVSKNLSLEYGNIIRLRALDSIIYYPESERELSEQKKNKCCFKPVWAKPKLTTNSLTYFIPRGTDFSFFIFFSYLLMRPKKKVALSAGGKKPAFEKQIGKKMNKKSWEQDAWQI